jgi:hypothetical protein
MRQTKSKEVKIAVASKNHKNYANKVVFKKGDEYSFKKHGRASSVKGIRFLVKDKIGNVYTFPAKDFYQTFIIKEDSKTPEEIAKGLYKQLDDVTGKYLWLKAEHELVVKQKDEKIEFMQKRINEYSDITSKQAFRIADLEDKLKEKTIYPKDYKEENDDLIKVINKDAEYIRSLEEAVKVDNNRINELQLKILNIKDKVFEHFLKG